MKKRKGEVSYQHPYLTELLQQQYKNNKFKMFLKAQEIAKAMKMESLKIKNIHFK